MFRTSVDEVHKASTAIKLGKKNSGVGLRLGAFDPLKTRPNTTVFTTPFSEYSASITTHPHFFQDQEKVFLLFPFFFFFFLCVGMKDLEIFLSGMRKHLYIYIYIYGRKSPYEFLSGDGL